MSQPSNAENSQVPGGERWDKCFESLSLQAKQQACLPNDVRRADKQLISRSWHVLCHHSVTCLLLLCVLILCLGACVPRKVGCLGTGGSNCDYIATGPQVDNAHFIFPTPPPSSSATPTPTPQLPGDAYWIRQGEQMQVLWDSYIFFSTKPGATCNPMIKPSLPDCQKCNLIVGRNSECSLAYERAPYLSVIAFNGFSMQSTPIELASAQSIGEVRTRQLSFTPTDNALLQLQAFYGTPFAKTLIETKVFVVANGDQHVTYPLTEITGQTDPRATGVIFYSGNVRLNDSKVSDNFSSSLQIGKVRVLKGTLEADPVTGKNRLANSSELKPSRLVLIPDYQQGSEVYARDNIRCYANYSQPPDGGMYDGGIYLDRCRGTPIQVRDSTHQCQLLSATPAYLKAGPAFPILTWVAEFKPADGGVAPTVDKDHGEVVAIEFTLK